MIEYINKRLIDWAALVKRRDDGGLGYPAKSNYCSLVQIHGGAAFDPIAVDAAAIEIDGIIAPLKLKRPQLHQVAYWFYLAGNLTSARVARELGCCRDTAYVRLDALHRLVQYELEEITLAADDRRAENKLLRRA